MSQKVHIDGVRHAGASVFLGVDHCNNPCWSRNPERIMVWLCDGWRTRFNQRREQRPHSAPVKDEAGEIIGWLREPLGGSDVPELISDREARLQCLWMAAVPSSILATTDRIEGNEWFAGLKRKKTAGGRVPGFKSRHRGLGFVCWYHPSGNSYNAVFHRTGRRSGVVVVTGMNPTRWVKPGEKAHWRIAIHVRVGQPIRPYTSVHVDWTHKSLVFTNMPLPLPRVSNGMLGLDRGCAHTLASSDGAFMDMPKPTKKEMARLRYLQRRLSRQDRTKRGAGWQGRQVRLQTASKDFSRVQRPAGPHRPAPERLDREDHHHARQGEHSRRHGGPGRPDHDKTAEAEAESGQSGALASQRRESQGRARPVDSKQLLGPCDDTASGQDGRQRRTSCHRPRRLYQPDLPQVRACRQGEP